MSNVLNVSNIGKSYKQYSSELWRIFSWFGIKSKSSKEAHTLKNINFSLSSGEAVGIVGQNGAGKSTLLKIITGTLKPSTGSVQVNGRIAAILELGMGFHPDLTGRQNVYHAAGIMGYTKDQIDAVIANIEAFAEIGDYFDQPVRHYSSGMQVRVAFAVATAYRPEILIIDEALSVGDVYFQHKSFERIRQFKQQGTTLLFVSHDKSSILALCDRVVLLEKGTIIKDGDPEVIMDYYNALMSAKDGVTIEQEQLLDGKVSTISGTKEAVVDEIYILNENEVKTDTFNVGEAISLCIKIAIKQDLEELVLGYGIKNHLGQKLFGTNTYLMHCMLQNVKAGDIYFYKFNFIASFGVGSYSVQTALHTNDNHLTNNYEWRDMALLFKVLNLSRNEFEGLCWSEPKIEVKKYSND